MRVRFGELSADEVREKERLCADAREAWRAFGRGEHARACELIELADPRLVLTVQRHPRQPLPCVELTALEACAWPLAELLLAQAPSDLDCALSLGRSAVSLEQALAEVRASHHVELERASVRAGFGRGHLLEITLGIPGGTIDENSKNAAENLVRALLGDRLFETWIGAVHVTSAPRGGPLRVLDAHAPRSTLRLAELFDTVAAAARGVHEGLSRSASDPESGLGSESLADADAHADAHADGDRRDWTLLEVEPLADSRGERKDDLVLASTCTPELLRCYLDGSPCASRRFSRSGERFVFVSYRDDEKTMHARVARRAVIEKALSESVTSAGVGSVTGVGFGVRTTYVDLALSDLETGLIKIVSTLKDADAPMHSFIQFFDSEFADEWISIWPNSRLTRG